MPTNEPNIYKLARNKAGFTQERAAEAIGVSLTSLKAYENYDRYPDYSVLDRMIQVYDAMYLAYQHVHICSGIYKPVPEVMVLDLPRAVIKLVNKVLKFAENRRDRQLLQIAEDGIIDETELPLFNEIMVELDKIVEAAVIVKCSESVKK